MKTTCLFRSVLVALCLASALVAPIRAELELDVPDHFLAAPGEQIVQLSWWASPRAARYTLKGGAAATGPSLSLSVANTVDSDGAGHDDSRENFAGADPQDPNSVLRLFTAERNGASVVFGWASVSNKVYRVACKGAFVDGGLE